MSNLKEKYNKEIKAKLIEQFSYNSIMQVPKIEKITINMGVGEALTNKKSLETAVADMELITGQKPVITKARKSVAGFKVREGFPIGCKVTLRSEIMWEFLDRLINIALPRVRDFRGVSRKSFDKQGNYNLGIKEQIIFPEIDYDKIDKIRGMDISISIKSNSVEESEALLKEFNFPFKQ